MDPRPDQPLGPARVDSCQTWRAKLQPWLIEQAPTIDLIVTTGYARVQQRHPGRAGREHAGGLEAPRRPRRADRRGPDNPRHSEDPLDCLERVDEIGPDTCATKEKDVLGNFDAFQETAGTVKGSMLLDLSEFYCRDDGVCPAVIGGRHRLPRRHPPHGDLLQDPGALTSTGAWSTSARCPARATRRRAGSAQAASPAATRSASHADSGTRPGSQTRVTAQGAGVGAARRTTPRRCRGSPPPARPPRPRRRRSAADPPGRARW